MQIIKRVLTTVISTILIFASVLGVSANETETIEPVIQVEYTSDILTYDEAIVFLVNLKGVTVGEAEEILDAPDSQQARVTTRATSFPIYTKTYTYAGGYTVEIGGMWEVWNEGSFREFNRLVESWTGAAGSGSYNWSEYFVADTTPQYPSITASLSARGTIDISVDHSVSGGLELGSELLGLGFSVATSTGSTYTYRYTQDLTLSQSLY